MIDDELASNELRPSRHRLANALPWILLVALTILFRLPALLNAAGVTNSDASIVGLQAMHAQKGEWSRFIWGAPYQGSIEVAIAALAFSIFGAHPLTLVSVTLVGYVLQILITFDILRRRIGRWKSFLACLVLVFVALPVNYISLQPPRQWSIFLVFVSVWMFDRAARAKLDWLWFGLATLVAALAVYGDLFVVMLCPAIGLFAIACAWNRPPRRMMRNLGAIALAGVAGAIALWLLRRGEQTNKTELTLSFFGANAKLLFGECLPWLFGYGVYIPENDLYPTRWRPGAFAGFQTLSALVFAMMLIASVALAFTRHVAFELRRLALFGAVASFTSLALFLTSPVPTDMWSTRYLNPIVWTAPLTLAPILSLVSIRLALIGILPNIVTAAVGGWVSYGSYVDGLVPARSEQGSGVPERELMRFFRDHQIKTAVGNYWLAYRLSFLFVEDPVVVPWLDVEDRFAPYRKRSVQAVVLHPSEPRLDLKTVEEELTKRKLRYRRFDVGKYTVLVFD